MNTFNPIKVFEQQKCETANFEENTVRQKLCKLC